MASLFTRQFSLGWNIWDYSDDKGVTNTEEFKKMPSFPDEGYIKVINNVVVVKLEN